MRTKMEHDATHAQFARSAFEIDRASGQELLRRGLAVSDGLLPGRLVEIGASTGVVYAIQAAPASPVKVGYSLKDALRGRLGELQGGNPYRLSVLAQAPGYLTHERRSHKALASDRLTGEWFSWSPRVAAFVRALKEDGVEAAIAAANIAKDRP